MQNWSVLPLTGLRGDVFKTVTAYYEEPVLQLFLSLDDLAGADLFEAASTGIKIAFLFRGMYLWKFPVSIIAPHSIYSNSSANTLGFAGSTIEYLMVELITTCQPKPLW